MGRRKPKQLRQLKHEKVIFVEGDTEEFYFNMLKQRYHGGNVKVKIQNKTGQKAVKLVDEASSWRKNHRNFEGDLYVCFDDDDQDKQLLLASYRQAQRQQIQMIYSNVCIEAWLLMHFIPVQGNLDNWRQKAWLYHQLEQQLKIQNYPAHKGEDLTIQYEDRIIYADRHCRQLTGNRQLNGDIILQNQVYTNFNQAIKTIFEIDQF